MAESANITNFACVKCGIEKPHTPEYFVTRNNSGVLKTTNRCRDCQSRVCREYRLENLEALREFDRKRNLIRGGAGSEYNKARYARRDKLAHRADLDRWKAENPEKARALEIRRNKKVKHQRHSDPEFREKLNKKSRDWQRNKRQSDPEFRDKALAATKEWLAANPEWVRENSRKKRLRQKDDPNYKIMASVRSRLIHAIKGQRENKRTAELLGAPIEVIRAHIEAQFVDDMSWSNWGRGWHGAREWHLDHIRPLASFDLSDPEQLAQASHYTNLQPLWARDNLRKGDRYR